MNSQPFFSPANETYPRRVPVWLLLAGAVLALPATALACTGQWSAQLLQSQLVFEGDDGWIPGEINLDSALQGCALSAILTTSSKPANRLRDSAGNLLSIEYFDDQRQPLSKTKGKLYQLALPAQATTGFWIRLPQARVAPAGIYDGSLQIDFPDMSNEPNESQSYPLSHQVDPLVAITVDTLSTPGLSGSEDLYQLDLGTLYTGLRQEFSLSITSNTQATLHITTSQGELQHEDDSLTVIPYSLLYNSQPYPPGTPIQQDLGLLDWATPVGVSLGIEVGDTSSAPGGRYQETFVVTVSAQG